jgi:hypothetical protein
MHVMDTRAEYEVMIQLLNDWAAYDNFPMGSPRNYRQELRERRDVIVARYRQRKRRAEQDKKAMIRTNVKDYSIKELKKCYTSVSDRAYLKQILREELGTTLV